MKSGGPALLGFEPMPAHEGALRLGVERAAPIELIQLDEVRIKSGRVEDQETEDIRSGITEGVHITGGHQDKAAASDDVLSASRGQQQLAREDVEPFDHVWMPVRRRSPRAGWHLALEERERTHRLSAHCFEDKGASTGPKP